MMVKLRRDPGCPKQYHGMHLPAARAPVYFESLSIGTTKKQRIEVKMSTYSIYFTGMAMEYSGT